MLRKLKSMFLQAFNDLKEEDYAEIFNFTAGNIQ